MDLFDLLLQVGLVTTGVVAYLVIFRKSSPSKLKGNYRQPGWNYFFRLLNAKFAVKGWKARRPEAKLIETPRLGQKEGWDSITIRASAPDGSTIVLGIRKLHEKPALAEVTVTIKLPDGTSYTLPQHPETVVGRWEDVESGWSAGGLKIVVTEEQMRLRILYNGLLKREDGITQHVRCNFLWTSASPAVRYPEDWSNELAAQALALEPWRDGDWPSLLGKVGDGSWLQWGVVQGRFESYDNQGSIDQSVYLRTRGTKERSWSISGYQGLRRAVSLVGAARDGTAVQLRAFSYKDVLTVGYSGCVRFPDTSVESLTGTDFSLPDFCEFPGEVPKVFSINVSTKKRDVKLIVRVNPDGGKLLSGFPHQQEILYRTVHVDIDGHVGTGVLELGYRTAVRSTPTLSLPKISLRWSNESEVGAVEYCAPFESRVAACPNHVGGKGASLALLASVQNDMGYKVPPGYCLTTKALDKHLESHPELKSAILDIEAANEHYDENNFRQKCDKAAELFAQTEIQGEVREQILSHLTELRKKALEQNLGPELRFAVRSSAVGEDSEALSAAGQNETILGCVSETDVLRGVQLCWGSMFAFTSAHYRRQNGQPCLCGGGVVIQALVSPKAAGVMFTRHPAAGDPSRLLITANYGLGESVVSGSVEPDTIIVSRGKELSIANIELGSKKQRITAVGSTVATEEVTEEERKLPCLTVAEIMKLARIGVAQEEAWGAGRDIEWAVTKDAIYLLQARPITSLERWTEEELLHEMDTAIMSDDELISFGNTGEVLPKPMSALSYDLMINPMVEGIDDLIHGINQHDRAMAFTHQRGTLRLYNSTYRFTPKEIDLAVRMMEISVFGHKIMDEHMLSVAQHRRPYSRLRQLKQLVESVKYLLFTKWCMNDAIKAVKGLHINTDGGDPQTLLERIVAASTVTYICSKNHATTSAASTVSQLISMIVLIEGEKDYTPEQCAEMNVLLSSGGVLSAEVPQALAKIARLLEDMGKTEEFRAQDPKKALDWLKTNAPKAHQEVAQFLEVHGHRAIMEFDLATKPWALVPEQMMEVLQNVRASEEQPQPSKTDDEIIASLKTPQKPNTRKVLRWVLPLCRRTVRHREHTKAQLILSVHKVRVALLELGKLLVKSWHLPDEDLVFHFRLNELQQYLKTRDPALLKKAMQRRQYYPSWCKLKFAEMNFGFPQPLQSTGPRITSADVRLEATAVCGGEVVGRACVVKELSEPLQSTGLRITSADVRLEATAVCVGRSSGGRASSRNSARGEAKKWRVKQSINFGYVQPLQSTGPRITSADVRLEATAVCGGEVVGRAYVVKELSESTGPRITSADVRLEATAVCGGEVVGRACVVKELSESTGPRITSADVRLEVTAVCGGGVVGRACVVKELSEIGQLQPGDILITHSTDIGWSPYFPLLSGIVTELGGLISHGAVIAREYGLPCLVGATDATDIFRTGDTVRLAATNGFIERVVVTPEIKDEIH
ncbi:pyruvate phosphate dikinase, PEP/pyruvate binding domain-containing protein [Phthorimaea operculella]|nr:pyruvate phosphate dikinase, PEP/pyruvate binding domain-containing protein [Phthorimaea operculella]